MHDNPDSSLLACRPRIRAILETNLIPFWMEHGRDREQGGFHGDLEVDGHATSGCTDKSLVQTSRFLWTFSALYRRDPRPEYREIADEARAFLVEHFLDRERGGWFYRVTREGEPIDRRKHLYAHAYCLYALSEDSLAFGDSGSRELAEATFEAIETHGRDVEFGGYRESFSEEWREIEQHTDFGRGGNCKTLNTHLHLLEAFACRVRATGDGGTRESLRGLIRLFLDRLIDPSRRFGFSFLEYDWTPIPSGRSIGHDIELSWLLDEAARDAAFPDAGASGNAVAEAVIGLARAVVEEGFDPMDGGIRAAGGEDRVWWEQAEGLVGFLNAFERTGEGVFAEAFVRTLDWIERHQMDRERGEWYWSANPSGPTNPQKGGIWKTPYHNVRACLECLERLDRME